MKALNVLASADSIAGVKAHVSNVLLLLVLAAAAGTVAFLMPRGAGPEPVDEDTPLAMPKDGEVDYRFLFYSAWAAAVMPKAERFDPPMGSEHGGLVYNAQKYWEMNEKRGGYHLGDDLNGIGGMNTDLGDPVFSTADGLVVYAGEPSPGWGNTVLVARRAKDGKLLQTMYAHLHEIRVKRGDLIGRGDVVGTVGTSNGFYLAHLHYELRESDGPEIGGGYGMDPLNRLDPMATVNALRNAAADELSPAPLKVMNRN